MPVPLRTHDSMAFNSVRRRGGQTKSMTVPKDLFQKMCYWDKLLRSMHRGMDLSKENRDPARGAQTQVCRFMQLLYTDLVDELFPPVGSANPLSPTCKSTSSTKIFHLGNTSWFNTTVYIENGQRQDAMSRSQATLYFRSRAVLMYQHRKRSFRC